MKTITMISACLLLMTACQRVVDKEEIRKEIFQTEKAFETMAAEKGIAEAFYYFADENAVIKRENDTLVIGRDNIKAYYGKIDDKNTTVNWSPDYVDVSECGTLGYTYGKYLWRLKNKKGEIKELKGVFHTVWKKQSDNQWRYVWD